MRDRKKRYYSELVDLLRTADVALEIVDARFIEETRVPKLERRFGNKVLPVAAKADLVPKEKRRKDCSYVSVRTGEGIKGLLSKASQIAISNPFRRTKDAKIVVFGLPNTGKSSLINALARKKVAKSGFRAGLTHGPQWIRISKDLMICDTAGVVQTEETEQSLALKAGIDVTELKHPELTALKIIAKAAEKTPNPLLAHYGIKDCADAEDLLSQIAKKRGLLGKGCTPLISEAAMVIVRDYQKGKFLI